MSKGYTDVDLRVVVDTFWYNGERVHVLASGEAWVWSVEKGWERRVAPLPWFE